MSVSVLPIDLDKVRPEDLDKQILRAGLIAELDAISLYEQMAALARDEAVKRVLLDIAKEEKTHVGEFLALLLKLDAEQAGELRKGEEEVREFLRGR
ncbi:MAG TPA: rubrerythrin [Candidatus Bathyarchaeota archaeon]|nr:rubrerythrin [Candidatus Bathyarchaeota archaeon]